MKDPPEDCIHIFTYIYIYIIVRPKHREINMAGNDPNTHLPNNAFRSLDSPDSDHTTAEPDFEMSEFFEFDDWVEEDPPFMVNGHPQIPVNVADEVNNAGGSSSSHHEGLNSSKLSYNKPFLSTNYGADMYGIKTKLLK